MTDAESLLASLRTGTVVRGVVSPEPVEIVSDPKQRGAFYKLEGRGMTSGKFNNPNLSLDQLAQLTVTPLHPPYDGDAHRFKLGIEAARLGLAYEYAPYFSLSIARVDPLPHQLEAVRLVRPHIKIVDDGTDTYSDTKVEMRLTPLGKGL